MTKLYSRRKKALEGDGSNANGYEPVGVSQGGAAGELPEQSRFVRVAPSRIIRTLFGWFALTREQDDLGPFPTEQGAKEALYRYLLRVEPNGSREFSPCFNNGVLVHDSETCKKKHCAFCIEASGIAEEDWSELIGEIDFSAEDFEW